MNAVEESSVVPPTIASFSIMMTSAPASRAAMAAPIPAPPLPTTRTSVVLEGAAPAVASAAESTRPKKGRAVGFIMMGLPGGIGPHP